MACPHCLFHIYHIAYLAFLVIFQCLVAQPHNIVNYVGIIRLFVEIIDSPFLEHLQSLF